MAKMAKAAVLVAPGKFEIKEFPIPPIGDDEMLVKVEGCGVCCTDGHEYKRDPVRSKFSGKTSLTIPPVSR